MKILIATILTILLSTSAFATAEQGQRYYQKNIYPLFGKKGNEVTKLYTAKRWKKYFKNDAKLFIKKFSKKFPKSNDFLHSADFQKIAPDLLDFFVKYSLDSGEFPKCD